MIAVTGGTGFIGHRLCVALRQNGHAVRVLARSAEKARDLVQHGVELVVGDLSDSAALLTLIENTSAVIHCAGAVRGRKLEDFHDVNVAAVGRLLTIAGQHNPQTRLLFLSSLAAREPSLSHYANSKFLGEQAALSSASPVAFSIIRPPPVYGPGDRELLPLFRLMAKGVALVPGRASDRVSLIYVDDLVMAVRAWLALDEVPREIFTLCDDAVNGYSWREITAIASEVFNRGVHMFRVPSFLLDGLASINQAASGILGYAPMLTPGKIRELRHPDWCCDNLSFHAKTGWSPHISFSEGLKLTMAGYS